MSGNGEFRGFCRLEDVETKVNPEPKLVLLRRFYFSFKTGPLIFPTHLIQSADRSLTAN